MEGIKNFLKETKYCDINDREIVKKVKQITGSSKTDKEKAISLFYWVRDNIPYTLGSWSKKASEVLGQQKGMCTNKSVLFVSFLRSINIPAGFGILKVKGQHYLGPIALPLFKKRIGKQSVHIYSYVFLGGKWMKVDPSADKLLSDKTSYFNPTTELVDWDGVSDAVENLDPRDIIEDIGPIANIDNKLDKKPKNARGAILNVANIYIDYLRQNENRVESIDSLQAEFFKWLRRKHFFYYLFFKMTYFYRDIKLIFKQNEKFEK